MLPDRVSNPGPLTYESGALPIALRSPAKNNLNNFICNLYDLLVKMVKLQCKGLTLFTVLLLCIWHCMAGILCSDFSTFITMFT